MERRDFIRTSGLVLLGLATGACGSGAKLTPGKATLDDVVGSSPQLYNVIFAGTEVLSKDPERIAFGLVDAKTGGRVLNATGDLWLSESRTAAALGPYAFTYHGEGLGEKGIYEANITFPADGQWVGVARITAGGKSAQIGAGQLQVGHTSPMPVTGDPAISVPTPTFSDHRGVNPICTRVPMCSMHAISLDAALKNGKPTVLIIATPAFCQSQLCGPETDLVDEAAHQYGDKANFVHIEVYKDNKPATIQRQLTSPAANAWKLDQEPAIYFINTAGVITQRSLGPLDRVDVQAYVKGLVG